MPRSMYDANEAKKYLSEEDYNELVTYNKSSERSRFLTQKIRRAKHRDNKGSYECECGSSYKLYGPGKKQHEKTYKHLQYAATKKQIDIPILKS
jgi:hypothetical protein